MRKAIFINVILFFILNYCYVISCLGDDRREFQPPPAQPHQLYQDNQANRPMPPPMVPSMPTGIPPMPSPHLSVPPMTTMPINIPSPASDTGIQKVPINAIPSMPAIAPSPAANMAQELAPVPIIGNSLGKVLNIGSEKDGLPWIEVKDDIFDELLRIQINPANTPVIKKATVMSFKDIKIGDTVNVIFNQVDQEIIANFVSIMTEEDLKAMEESVKTELPVGAEAENKPADSAKQ